MSILKHWHCFLIFGFAFFWSSSTSYARPSHKRALADHFGSFLSKKLNDCRTCHLPAAKEDEDDRPHNVFGARLKAVRLELKKAGEKSSLVDRVAAVADEDSDGDGAENLLELLTGHFPGEKEDCPDAKQLAKAKVLLVEFRRATEGYPWRPFEKVERPPIPSVKNKAWVRNPIDAFIAAEHEALGLRPRPEAPKAVLLRRVYLDLIGLPPTPKELRAFLNDASPDAYEKVVDELLNRPQYGERWGRHWMDIWRYSDWAGYGAQVRDSKPHIWQWRDWIIEALNDDKGYDQMVKEMLAADELMPTDLKALRATGYLVRNYKLLSRERWMRDAVEHTAQAFLGVTMKCCRCHDHMYDPISQKNYYQFRAIFEPYQVRTDRLPGESDVKKFGLVLAYDADLKAPTYLFLRGDDRTPDKSKVMTPHVPEALGGPAFKVEPIVLPRFAFAPDKREYVINEDIQAGEAAIRKAEQTFKAVQEKGMAAAQLAELDLQVARSKHQALLAVLAAEKLEDAGRKDSEAWKENALAAAKAQRRAAWLQAKRNLLAKEQALTSLEKSKKGGKQLTAAKQNVTKAKQALAKADAENQKPLTTKYQPRNIKIYPKTSTGRRTALAKWIAHRDNPLTARVAVNHIWLRHFGEAILPTVFDFGRNGQPPSHPALLDWLAAEFMKQDWSMKKLHRLIVTSSAYRMDSTPNSANAAVDPDNKYVWRFKPRRVESEVVRDCIYHVAGKLDLTMGGKEIPFGQGMSVPRRSIYFQHAAEKQMQFMDIFDGPSVTECYRRKQAIVPQQALALYNNDLVRKHARLIARKLAERTKVDATAFINLAFEQVLSRTPKQEEISACQAFLKKTTEYHSAKKNAAKTDADDPRFAHPEPAIRAREQLVHVLMNHHEFVTMR